jgi:hypothetical protein
MTRSLSHNDSSVTSNTINQMPKYIFEHNEFKSVETIKKRLNSENIVDHAELPEYPIEEQENQEHAIQRNISVG